MIRDQLAFHVLVRTLATGGWCGVLIVTLVGCGARTPDQTKADSWNGTPADLRPRWNAYLASRAWPLICRDDTAPGSEDGTGRFLATIGIAIAISADGYLLSAAHAAEGEGPYWIALGPDRHLPCRLVWRSTARPNDDWALLKATRPFTDTMAWSPAAPKIGDEVIAGSNAAQASHGLLDGMWTRQACDHTYTMIIHSAPLTPGDSGGPVVDRDGGLIGISYGIDHDRFGRWTRSYAVRPDPAFVQRLIDEDRQRQGAGANAPAPAP